MTYIEKLRDPRWQRLSAIVKERAEWRCERCGDHTRNLQAHHKLYERGLEPWDYPPYALECLCAKCHKRISDLTRRLKYWICDLETDEMERLIKNLRSKRWKRVELPKIRMDELRAELWRKE